MFALIAPWGLILVPEGETTPGTISRESVIRDEAGRL